MVCFLRFGEGIGWRWFEDEFPLYPRYISNKIEIFNCCFSLIDFSKHPPPLVGDAYFLRQKPVGDYIVDFYCAGLQLVIEIDGDSHAESAEYDAERTRFLGSLGLRVIRFSNDDVLRNIEGVYEELGRTIAALDMIIGDRSDPR